MRFIRIHDFQRDADVPVGFRPSDNEQSSPVTGIRTTKMRVQDRADQIIEDVGGIWLCQSAPMQDVRNCGCV
jgi:hypothetical protein